MPANLNTCFSHALLPKRFPGSASLSGCALKVNGLYSGSTASSLQVFEKIPLVFCTLADKPSDEGNETQF